MKGDQPIRHRAPLIRAKMIWTVLGIATCIGTAGAALLFVVAAALSALFIVLKVAAVISIGWIWTVAPLWIVIGLPIAFTIITLIVVLLINSIIFVVYHFAKLLRQK